VMGARGSAAIAEALEASFARDGAVQVDEASIEVDDTGCATYLVTKGRAPAFLAAVDDVSSRGCGHFLAPSAMTRAGRAGGQQAREHAVFSDAGMVR
jgi:hypothetical protein